MKTRSTFFALLIFIGIGNLHAQTTSVANGNWTSPSTWGGMPPTPGSTVIINHTVTLDLDYGYSTGSITINGTGTLNGNSSMRALALSGGTLTVNGTLNIPRVAFLSGTITNSGTFQNDSLFNQATFTNTSNGIINATQFMISTGGNFTNNGTVTSTNFLNIETVNNTSTLNSVDLLNSKSFTNSATGTINISNNFLNTDSLTTPNLFTNNGSVIVGHDWRNAGNIDGSGGFCIQNNSSNSGSITGTIDFCDQTGSDLDLNTGSIVGTVTYCQSACSVGVKEISNSESITLYPNPNNGTFTISADIKNSTIEIIDLLGKTVYSEKPTSLKSEIRMPIQSKGIYLCKIINEKNETLKVLKIIIN